MGAVPSYPKPISTEICRNFLTIESVMLCSASFDDCDLCPSIVFKKKETNIKSRMRNSQISCTRTCTLKCS